MQINVYGKCMTVDSPSNKTGILRENFVNTMAADDLAPYVARPSAAMILIMKDKHIFDFL